METQTTQAAAPAPAAPPPVALVGYRGIKEKGMPKTGFGLLVALPKSGKSELAAGFPGAYVLELDEHDADHIAGRIDDIMAVVDMDGNEIKSKMQVFREKLNAATKDPSVQTIVIDTVETLVGLFQDEIAAKHGVASMSVKEKGVNTRDMWGELKQRVENLVDYMNASGKLFVLCTHCKAPEKDENGVVTIPAGINVPGQSSAVLAGRAKFIGYCYKKELGTGQGYYVSFRGGPLGVWGSRVAGLNDKTLLLPKGQGYAVIEAAANAQPEAVPAEAQVPAAETKTAAPAKDETTAPKAVNKP